MIKYGFLIGLFLPFLLHAQNQLPRTKLPANLQSFDLSQGSEKIPSAKYEGYLFAYDAGNNSLYWYGKLPQDMIILQAKWNPAPFAFEPKLFSRFSYENQKIYLCSRIPNKAEEKCGVFDWTNFKIEFENVISIDPNPDLIARADSLTQAGEVARAAELYAQISHFKSYADPALKANILFQKAFEKADVFAKQNRLKNALDILKPVMPFVHKELLEKAGSSENLDKMFAKKPGGMSADDLRNKLRIYMEWAIKARDVNFFMEQHSFYMLLSANDPEWYRLRGDAYFALRDREKYKDNYILYCNKMKTAKKEKDIPPYVIPRSK